MGRPGHPATPRSSPAASAVLSFSLARPSDAATYAKARHLVSLKQPAPQPDRQSVLPAFLSRIPSTALPETSDFPVCRQAWPTQASSALPASLLFAVLQEASRPGGRSHLAATPGTV